MNSSDKNRSEFSQDEKSRVLRGLVESYENLLFQEGKARQNGDERHLKACLDAQQRCLKKINRIMPLMGQGRSQEKTPAQKLAAVEGPGPEAATSAIASNVMPAKPAAPVAAEAVTSPEGNAPLRARALNQTRDKVELTPLGIALLQSRGIDPLGMSTHSTVCC